jgi:hypothetical protein
MARRPGLTELPFWPRLLSHDEAARYVGVSTKVFDQEVRQGIWPPALRRGARGGRLTWDRVSLDKAADRAASVEEAAEPGATGPAHSEADAAYWMERIRATSARKRSAGKTSRPR